MFWEYYYVSEIGLFIVFDMLLRIFYLRGRFRWIINKCVFGEIVVVDWVIIRVGKIY